MKQNLSTKIELAIQNSKSESTFIKNLLIDTLNWPLQADKSEFTDFTYEWYQQDLGIEKDHSKVKIAYQIPPFRDDNPWGIFVIEFADTKFFATGRGITKDLREMLRGLTSKKQVVGHFEREGLLFICTYNYEYFSFAHFKNPGINSKTTPLAAFGWGPDDPIHTICDCNLSHLCYSDSWTNDEWRKEWQTAFDVEQVTERFYNEYERVFSDFENRLVVEKIKGKEESETKRMFAQTIFNRLMFLRFIERKNWLQFGKEKDNHIYLNSLYRAGGYDSKSFYLGRLRPLFFYGLAKYNEGDSPAYGIVPFLNGGLFKEGDIDKVVVDLPDDVFQPLLAKDGLLYRYNFTVDESTPIDIEVGVDPEMLGKVFEKVVTRPKDRKAKGAFYTPRSIVAFMCKEALKGYLPNCERLIDHYDASDISIQQAKKLIKKVEAVKICDPACGSGAYLVGMLQELFQILKLLDTAGKLETPNIAYEAKLKIIQNNLYGVDLDEFAVHIARLRLWLSLSIDNPMLTPEPLPNLDYKIECGDSLSELVRTEFVGIEDKDINEFIEMKEHYLNMHSIDKDAYGEKIEKIREHFRICRGRVKGSKVFDWDIEFAEVMHTYPLDNAGFDIVIANPPYGVKCNEVLRDRYFSVEADGQKQSRDSYGIFMVRGIELLKPGGYFTYIISDTWRTLRTHLPLRKQLLRTRIEHFIDLPDWTFEAVVNTCILSLQKMNPEESHTVIAGDLRNLPKKDWKDLEKQLTNIAGHGPDVQTTTAARYTYPQELIKSYNGLSFFVASPKLYKFMSEPSFTSVGTIADVVVGLQTGDNNYYIRKYPDARGSYIEIDKRKVLTEEEITNLTNDEKSNGIDPEKYSGRHFLPYDKGGESDAKGGWLPNYFVPTEYYIDWSTKAVERMKNDRSSRFQNSNHYFINGISFSRTGQYAPTFRFNSKSVFDTEGSSIDIQENNQSRISHYILISYLCSKLARYFFKSFIDHTVHVQVDEIKTLPIPISISTEINKEITSIVERIVNIQSINRIANYLHEQNEIDQIVYSVYGLTNDDIREIELWYCRRYPKLAEAQGVLAEVKTKYASHLQRCELVLSKPPHYWKSHLLLQLIAQGEGQQLEFKATFAHDLATKSENKNLHLEVLKTIAAFLNSTTGGILLIGVKNSGEITGIEQDYPYCQTGHCDRDGFELRIRSMTTSRFDPQPYEKILFTFFEIDGKTVCQINVKPEPRPEGIYLDGDLFIRDGNKTQKLTGADIGRWVANRTTHSSA